MQKRCLSLCHRKDFLVPTHSVCQPLFETSELRNDPLIKAASFVSVQEFLRGHDADISALDISLNGKLLASGQAGAPGRKGAVAMVFVWDLVATTVRPKIITLHHVIFQKLIMSDVM